MRSWSITIGPDGGQGRKWTDLDIEFKVEKSGSSTPNKIGITIYNLSADSRGWCEKKGNGVILEAGYVDSGVKLLASAEIQTVTHDKDGPDWVTKICAADGQKAHKTIMHESFGPKTKESAVIKAIAKKMGVKLGNLKGLSDEEFAQGRQLSGAARFELDALCSSRGLRWSIQDGAIQILPIGSPTDADVILLSPASGLIGSPEKTEKGVKITSLLRGNLNPAQLVKLESRSLTGFYVAEKVTHEGDSSGGNWYTQIDAIARQ